MHLVQCPQTLGLQHQNRNTQNSCLSACLVSHLLEVGRVWPQSLLLFVCRLLLLLLLLLLHHLLLRLTCTVKLLDSCARRRTSAKAMVRPFSIRSLKLQARTSMLLGTNCSTAQRKETGRDSDPGSCSRYCRRPDRTL